MTSLVQIIWTVVAFVIFIGIVVWAWGSGRKAEFDKAARMALDDDEPISESKTRIDDDKPISKKTKQE